MLAQRWFGCQIAVGILVFSGCGSSGDSGGPGASMDQVASAVDAQKAARQQEAAAAAAKGAEDQQAAQATAAAQPAEPEKRAVGSRPQMQGGGYLRAIGSARRHVMNVVDNIAWIQGVRSFKAEEGRKPKNHEEFMKVVVPKYDLQLPKLEEDEEYLYDPTGESDGDYGQLFIVKKQTAEPAAPPSPRTRTCRRGSAPASPAAGRGSRTSAPPGR